MVRDEGAKVCIVQSEQQHNRICREKWTEVIKSLTGYETSTLRIVCCVPSRPPDFVGVQKDTQTFPQPSSSTVTTTPVLSYFSSPTRVTQRGNKEMQKTDDQKKLTRRSMRHLGTFNELFHSLSRTLSHSLLLFLRTGAATAHPPLLDSCHLCRRAKEISRSQGAVIVVTCASKFMLAPPTPTDLLTPIPIMCVDEHLWNV